ncbi:amino acid adenylation domain-containing protein [Embleya sp. NPDC001921]
MDGRLGNEGLSALPGDSRAVSVIDLLRRSAAETPDAAALTDGRDVLSYGELLTAARSLAARIADRGVGSGDTVMVCLPHGIPTVVAVLGIWMAGAVYVPAERSYPVGRLRTMWTDSGAELAIIGPDQEGLFATFPGRRIVLVPAEVVSSAREAVARRPEGDADDAVGTELAYIIYTSGTSGHPKGVRVTHAGLVGLIEEMVWLTAAASPLRMLAATSCTFDISLAEFLVPPAAGGTTVVVPEDIRTSPAALADFCLSTRITCVQATPTMWRLLAPHLSARLAVGLCGGEPLTKDVRDHLLAHCDRAFNMYGPTEATIWSSAWRIRASGEIKAGAPLRNNEFFILDDEGAAVADGEFGHLHIGGLALAAGYTDEALTARAFRAGTGALAGRRLYATGDLAAWSDGELVIRGRLDNQVKIHGRRIEVEEIEAVLGRHPSVRNCGVVVSGGDRSRGLTAFFEAEPAVDPDEITRWLATSLPPYMIPATIEACARLPLLPSGKLDRTRLEQRTRSGTTRPRPSSMPPRAEVERSWTEVRGAAPDSSGEDFFASGGDSLAAVHLLRMIRKRTGVLISLSEFYRYSRFGELVTRVEEEIEQRGHGHA